MRRVLPSNNGTALSGPIGTELMCLGWLRKNTARNWQCLTKPLALKQASW